MNSSATPEMIDTHWERLHPALLRLQTDFPLSGCRLHNVCIKKQVSFSNCSQATQKTRMQCLSAIVKEITSQHDEIKMVATLAWRGNRNDDFPLKCAAKISVSKEALPEPCTKYPLFGTATELKCCSDKAGESHATLQS